MSALMESSPLAIKEVDLENRVIVWNRAAERIFGWTREEMLGRLGAPMVPPSKQVEHEELVAVGLVGARRTPAIETVRRRKDGTLFEVMMAAAPVQDATGRLVRHVVVYNDITERKAQEAEVHRLNAELHARLEELAASRARIVAAGDVERRRLERNLHDGAQQRLVALSLSLRVALAQAGLPIGRPRARPSWSAGDELGLALAELRGAGARPASGGAQRSRPASGRRGARGPSARPGRDRGPSRTGGCL